MSSRVELLDGGLMSTAADVTGGDGVYSGYFHNFATDPGFYSVEVTAVNGGGAKRPVQGRRGNSEGTYTYS